MATTRVAPTGGPPTDYEPGLPRRRSVRLKAYDYAQPGAYFVTVVTQDRLCLFGDIADGEVRFNEAGSMVRIVWESLSYRFAGLSLDAFVVMPNHIHGVIVMDPPVAPCGRPLPFGERRPRRPPQGNHKGCPYRRGRRLCLERRDRRVQVFDHGRVCPARDG